MLDTPFYLLVSALPDLLIIAGMIAGLVLAVKHRARLGVTASTLAAVGLGLLVIGELVGLGWIFFVGSNLMRETGSVLIAGIQDLVSKLIWAVGLGLIVGAVFARRPAPQPPFPV